MQSYKDQACWSEALHELPYLGDMNGWQWRQQRHSFTWLPWSLRLAPFRRGALLEGWMHRPPHAHGSIALQPNSLQVGVC